MFVTSFINDGTFKQLDFLLLIKKTVLALSNYDTNQKSFSWEVHTLKIFTYAWLCTLHMFYIL